jgi:polyisoprenoid-binding protein YceI
MKQMMLPVLLLIAGAGLRSQTLTPVDSASSVTFRIKNLGFNTSGSIGGVAGVITFTPDNLAGCSFDVHVAAQTVNTDMDMRDEHLRGEAYLDAKKYPEIRFVSEKVTNSTKKGTLFVFGKLTLKGVTRDISFPFTAQPLNNGYQFSGTFQLNRRDFNVGGNSSTLSDNLTVTLRIVARKA